MKRIVLATSVLAITLPGVASADIVHADDVIVSDGSGQAMLLCVGADCVDGEPKNSTFDAALRMRGNNNIVEFDDTSSAGFPDRDWSIRINETSGGDTGEAFFIRDDTAGTKPIYIAGSAPSNALYIGAAGNIGLGTSVPQNTMHIVSDDSPGIMLQQIGGFGNQRWELSANEASFVVRDSDAVTYPLTIDAGAPDDALVVASSGKVGIGAASPSTGLHVKSTSGNGALLIEETSAGTLGQLTLRNNGITFFTLEDTSIAAGDNTGRSWNFQNQAGTFRVTTAPGGPGEIEMLMDTAGDMYIKGQLYTGTGGATTTCAAGCDRVFDADYTLPSIDQHAAEMRANRHLPAVGPTPEGGPYNLSQMTGGMLNELEKAHLYIDQLHQRLAVQEQRMARLESLVSER